MGDVRIEQARVVFDNGVVGLNDLNLTIDSGEFVALVGPSGSGKTTLLRALAGFQPLTGGEIRINGEDLSQVAPELRNMGMVFQEHAVWPHMSVRKNVEYPLIRAGESKEIRRGRTEAALALVGLSGYENRRPRELSGGQRQRVALARAIVGEPDLLLLDEALSALDEPLRDNLRRELVALTRKSNLTAVHVTHDRQEALAIADKIAVMRNGTIEQYGAPQKILAAPANAWVASFMGDATILRGRAGGGCLEAEGIDFRWPYEGPHEGEVELAVLPEHIQTADSGAPNSVEMEVESVLFSPSHYSLSLKCGVHRFRALMPATMPPVIGERIWMSAQRPLVFTTN